MGFLKVKVCRYFVKHISDCDLSLRSRSSNSLQERTGSIFDDTENLVFTFKKVHLKKECKDLPIRIGINAILYSKKRYNAVVLNYYSARYRWLCYKRKQLIGI